ncbi:MAG: serine protease, partial [Proteobacteria bacterium]|nr:serine protease [Pseudomonadota bacterium]
MRVALLLLGLGSTAFAGPRPVVGGQPAPPGKWPDIVALPFDGSADTVYCTGVLIAPTVVLTAGHCVNAPPAPGRVLIGVDSLAEPATGELIDVAAIHEYPSSQTSLDLAVLVLATPSTRTPRAVATGWARADILDDAAVALVGFGALDRDATQFSDVLHEATTTITDHDCSRALKGCHAAAQPAGELGAGGGGIDTCPGDSGGPLYLETTYGTFLAGITSRGYDDAKFLCSEGGIYERPDKVLAWIEEASGATIGRGPEPTAAPLDDAFHLQITPHDPKSTDHHYAIATP